MTTYYTSNDASIGFDALSTGVVPTNWVAKTGTWQVGTTQPTTGHTHTFGSTTRVDGDAALLSGISAVADIDLVYAQKLVWTGGHSPAIGPILRADAANANNYTVVMTGGGTGASYYVFKKVGGSYSAISAGSIAGSAAGITSFTNGDTMWIRARILGSTISIRAWKNGNAEPSTWDVSVTDTSVTAAGYAGFYYALDTNATISMAVDEVQALSVGLETLSVTTPGTTTAGAAMTIGGTYVYGTPTALDYQIDGGAWVAATSPTISGGNFSFSITAPAVGSHTVGVRDHAVTTTAVTSGSFTTTAGATIAITTPGTVLAGQAMTLSGTYSGTAPTGLNIAFDGGAYGPASGPAIGGGTWSVTTTAPALGSHTVSVQEANATGVTATSGSFGAALAPNNAAIVYSPYTWNVQSASATTANAGAALRTLFTGSTCILNFNVAAMASPASQIWWRIDNGPWTQATLAATIACTVPAITAGNSDVPYHRLEVVVKSMTELQNRWNAGTSTRVVFTGLTLASGANVAAPLSAPLNLLIYGDSITEGVRALGEFATYDTDRNDAMMGWAYHLGSLLGAEVGVVGFGAQGLAGAGSGNVPVLGTSWNLLYAGTSRSFTPLPDLIVINIGTNDGATNTVAAMTALLNNLITTCPGKPIAVLRPFNGSQAANLQAAIAACSTPGQCIYINTTGMFSATYGTDSINLHPAGPNNVTRIAPQLATSLRPLVAGSTTPWFRPGFRQGLV
jgi:hypothetical protein